VTDLDLELNKLGLNNVQGHSKSLVMTPFDKSRFFVIHCLQVAKLILYCFKTCSEMLAETEKFSCLTSFNVTYHNFLTMFDVMYTYNDDIPGAGELGCEN